MGSLFYDRREPTYFDNRSRHAPFYSNVGYGIGRSQVVQLLVPMCCTKCEEKIYEEMMELRGIQGVMVDRQAQRVIVHGFIDPLKALKRAKKVKRDSQLWSGAPYDERDIYLSPKYRRSAYRSPSLYRSSFYQYQPSLYRTLSYEFHQPSVYRSSFHMYTPAYRRISSGRQPWPVYDDMYNPYYVPYIESGFY
uniref:HMA domain-containing protein n=1 Tax=Physcomitrium patens TaxID=3218 RepID=A9RE40_PHYPA|nr:hypothetical protein PHYPA_021248 [Physcomitrium patens]